MKTLGTPEIAQIRPNVWVAPSRSHPGTLQVVKLVRGQLVCSCDADYHGRNCWHKNAVTEHISAAKRPSTELGLRLLGVER